jgi:hypothetical protein
VVFSRQKHDKNTTPSKSAEEPSGLNQAELQNSNGNSIDVLSPIPPSTETESMQHEVLHKQTSSSQVIAHSISPFVNGASAPRSPTSVTLKPLSTPAQEVRSPITPLNHPVHAEGVVSAEPEPSIFIAIPKSALNCSAGTSTSSLKETTTFTNSKISKRVWRPGSGGPPPAPSLSPHSIANDLLSPIKGTSLTPHTAIGLFRYPKLRCESNFEIAMADLTEVIIASLP